RSYPVLSILAKDIMTVPVSTISSESAFSLSGRLLDDRRRSLTPAHVERLSLIKDWEQAHARQQHNMQNKELEEMMENMFLDEDRSTLVCKLLHPCSSILLVSRCSSKKLHPCMQHKLGAYMHLMNDED